MKALFTFLLFIISASLLSLDTDTLLQYSTPINLSYGIEAPVSKQSINDFSTISKDVTVYKSIYSVDKEDVVTFSPIHNYWYAKDFPNEPFDGRIEVLVMGEPLPSFWFTLLTLSILSTLIIQYNRKHLHPPKLISEKSLI